MGNCVDLGLADFLEYLAADSDTNIIAMYIESIRGDGRRFFDLLKKVGTRKPIVVFKSGRTSQVEKMVASHTGALAGDYSVWKAVFKQTGVIEVNSLGEMVDVIVGLKKVIPRPTRGRIAVIGNGGSHAVISGDLCAEHNLVMSPLSIPTQRQLNALDLPPGTSIQNPIDTPASLLRREDGHFLRRILKPIALDPNIEAVVVSLEIETIIYDRSKKNPSSHYIINMLSAIREIPSGKAPVILIFRSSDAPELAPLKKTILEESLKAGLPIYWDLRSAITTLERLVRYSNYTGSSGRKRSELSDI